MFPSSLQDVLVEVLWTGAILRAAGSPWWGSKHPAVLETARESPNSAVLHTFFQPSPLVVLSSYSLR